MPRTRGLLAIAAAVLVSAAAIPATSGDAPIADAAMRGDSAQVRALVKQGADVNAAQGDGMTALHWAAMRGEVDEAKMLIFAGARLDAATRNGNYTPLHLAARAGKPAVIKALLQAGAAPNAVTTSGGATPLHLAAAQGSAESINALLEKGALVNARETAFGQTPLMWAAAYDRVNAVRALASHGADLKATSKVESVPVRDSIDRAALQLRTRRAALLRSADQPPAAAGRGRGMAADPTAAPISPTGPRGGGGVGAGGGGAGGYGAGGPPVTAADSQRLINNRGLSFGELVGNKGGLTALAYAAREGNTDCALALIQAGADINEVSAGDHSTPLLLAAINGQFDLAKTLLDRGANPKLASDAGATPLYATLNVQWAAKASYPQPTARFNQKATYLELMEDLLNKGADPNVRLTKHLWYMSYIFDLLGVNTAGATPFWRAAYGLDVPAMKLLMAHGADPNIPTLKPAGRLQNPDAPAELDSTLKSDPSGLPPIPVGGPGVYAIHAASGVGYGEGFAANAHQHAPDAWIPAVKYLVEDLHLDINIRDFNGYNAVHHAAARGDNQLIEYLVSKGADVKAISRKGQTTVDMANGPVQRIPPFLDTVALLEKLGAKNSHKCKSC
ncbi:MAG: ankyrin repeat domain-containing protein [bacterium]